MKNSDPEAENLGYDLKIAINQIWPSTYAFNFLCSFLIGSGRRERERGWSGGRGVK